MTKLTEIKITQVPKYGEEHTAEFLFPNWTKEQYLDFVEEWKETYKIWSRYVHLCKRARKTVHNVMSPEERAEMAALENHPSIKDAREWVRGNVYHYIFSNKQVARWLLEIRKASKVWAGKQRAATLKAA